VTEPLRATYRLQFNRDFTFADAEALVDYLGLAFPQGSA
jgi:maltooligosyltrehalose synthase